MAGYLDPTHVGFLNHDSHNTLILIIAIVIVINRARSTRPKRRTSFRKRSWTLVIVKSRALIPELTGRPK